MSHSESKKFAAGKTPKYIFNKKCQYYEKIVLFDGIKIMNTMKKREIMIFH